MPLGDWHLNLLGEWREGVAFTWTGDVKIEGVKNNVRWRDYSMLDMRLSKNIHPNVVGGTVQLFVDIYNVFNLKHLRRHGVWHGGGDRDYEQYMESLHLPEDTFGDNPPPYEFIPGNDTPGDYRKDGVDFHPIEIISGDIQEVQDPHPFPLYYVKETGTYMEWKDGNWEEADSDLVNQVLDDKAYIDMPNLRFHSFLNPRSYRIGIRFMF